MERHLNITHQEPHMFGATIRELVFAGFGFVGGAFTPAIGRKIKTYFSNETHKIVLELKAKVDAIEAEAKANVVKAV